MIGTKDRDFSDDLTWRSLRSRRNTQCNARREVQTRDGHLAHVL